MVSGKGMAALGGCAFGAVEGLLLALVCWCTGRAMQSERGALFGMLAVMAITMKAMAYALAMAFLGNDEGAGLTCFLVGAAVVYSGAVGWAAVRR